MTTSTSGPLRRRLVLPLLGLLALSVVAALAFGAAPRRATAVVSSAPVAPSVGHSRPNIIVVMADDMRTDDLRFMPQVRRQLVGHGLTFRNSFSPYPLCCPARASFLTGQYAHNHRVFSHKAPWGFEALDDRQSIATAVHGSGYNTAFVGKYLNGYGAQRSRVTGKPSLKYVPHGWTDWYGAVQRPHTSPYKSGGTYNYMHTIFNVNGRIDDTHKGQYQTDVLGRFSRKLVRKYSRGGKPFFMWFSAVAPHFGGPHEKDDPSRVLTRRHRFVNIKTPARPKWVRGHFDKQIVRASGLPRNGGPSEADISDKARPMRNLPELSRAERLGVRQSTRQRAEALFVLDKQVGALVSTLKATGQWRNTVLLFTSDNGYFLGEHRRVQGKINAQEPSLRVPLVVAGRGVPHGVRFDPATTPGLTATVADLAGATSRLPHPGDGLSLVPSFHADHGWTVPIVTEGREDTTALPTAGQRAAGFDDPRNTIGIRTGRWKYIAYSNGDDELYDLDADPNELQNLVNDPSHHVVLDELRQVWRDYKDCKGESCRAPMPADLQLTPAQDKAGTNRQSRGVQARYGYWR
jgi:N-acetylglucosamine-6-sulfatase